MVGMSDVESTQEKILALEAEVDDIRLDQLLADYKHRKLTRRTKQWSPDYVAAKRAYIKETNDRSQRFMTLMNDMDARYEELARR